MMGGTSNDRVIRRDEKLEDAAETFVQASNKLKLERYAPLFRILAGLKHDAPCFQEVAASWRGSHPLR